MVRSDSEDFQVYFSRIRPIYAELFNLAHAVTGASAQAEYSLQYAMLECWSLGELPSSRHGFRGALRSATLHAALKAPRDAEAEEDWDGLQAPANPGDAIARMIAQEPIELRRMLALRYGCGLSLRRSARLASVEPRRAQQMLQRFEARARRTLPAADRRRFELRIARAVRSGLSQPSPQAPEIGSVFRTFQADAASISRPSRLPVRILRVALAAVLALLCVAAFWMAAVLMQPARLESPVAQSAVLEEQAAPGEG